MHTSSPGRLAAALFLVLLLVACGEREAAAPPPAQQAPAPAPPPTTDQWIGQWDGPEGTFLNITGGSGQYEVTVQNLDGPRTFAGNAAGEAIEFERDGKKEVLRASNGEQTGMKWLAKKKDCLRVRAGEGYCRD